MTALHQFGAEMLKLSKRLESYPAAGPAPRQPLPPSPLLLQSSSTYNNSSHVSSQRLIRSTTNASIVNQRANNRDEVGDDTRVHYHTQADDGVDDTAVDYQLTKQQSPPQVATPPGAAETISEERHRYIFRTCKPQRPEDQKLSTTFPRISINDTVG